MTVKYTGRPARLQAPTHAAAFHEWVFPDGTRWTQFFRVADGYLLRFPNLADFMVSDDGTEAQSWAAPGLTSATVEHLYLNQVLPLALSRQGRLVLHASAVDIGGHGVAFLGESGRGKSTMAAGFAAVGTRFLTDDGLLLEWNDNRCMVVPSHPSIRLWQDSQEALMSEQAEIGPTLDFTSKVRFLAGRHIAFCDERRPLRRIYFLGDGRAQSPIFEPLRSAEALIELVKHSFLLDIEAQDMLCRHFDDLTRLAELPIFYRLDYPRRYDDLPTVRSAIIQHVSE